MWSARSASGIINIRSRSERTTPAEPPMTTGMLLGKFFPPHLGHIYLGEFAARFADRLTIVVCSLNREPIPGELRLRWVRELFPFETVVHLTDELPQEPA